MNRSVPQNKVATASLGAPYRRINSCQTVKTGKPPSGSPFSYKAKVNQVIASTGALHDAKGRSASAESYKEIFAFRMKGQLCNLNNNNPIA